MKYMSPGQMRVLTHKRRKRNLQLRHFQQALDGAYARRLISAAKSRRVLPMNSLPLQHFLTKLVTHMGLRGNPPR